MNYIQSSTRGGQEGYRGSYDIFSRLANERNLFITGEIDNDIASLIIAQMLYLNSKDSHAPISLYINSPGGDVLSGLAIVDAMKSIQAPVYTFCIGLCASAAALIFSSGKKGHRYAYSHSRIMIHTVRGMMNGPIGDVAINYNLMQELNDDVYDVLSINTGQEILKIKEDTQRDCWFRVADAIAYGLVDKTIDTATSS